ncbi:MAG TPA: cytochrome c oxidase subunit II [Solirubrobacterales bacterium]|nr:cytochrome c oxidase subunit II [Solirubrobacterales bacterium]
MRRLPIVKLTLATLVLATVISVIMVPIRWNGQQASTAAVEIDRLLDVMIVLSAIVFSIVVVALAYALIRFRAKPGDESDGEPIHGNTRLEIIWTVIPTIIVLFAAGYSWVVLDDIEARDADRMTVNVFSQQFTWNFTYPDDDKHSPDELHVPVGQQIEFKLHALDVIHSFWVPEWRIKKDNVPGIVTRAIVTPDREGTYQLICTELCGYGHSTMRATVVVESQEAFDQWLEEQQEIPDAYTQQAALTRDPDYD